MSFNGFIHEYSLKNKATSITKIYQILSCLAFNVDGIYSRDGSFKTDIGIVNVHRTKGTHWVLDINQNYFDS